MVPHFHLFSLVFFSAGEARDEGEWRGNGQEQHGWRCGESRVEMAGEVDKDTRSRAETRSCS